MTRATYDRMRPYKAVKRMRKPIAPSTRREDLERQMRTYDSLMRSSYAAMLEIEAKLAELAAKSKEVGQHELQP